MKLILIILLCFAVSLGLFFAFDSAQAQTYDCTGQADPVDFCANKGCLSHDLGSGPTYPCTCTNCGMGTTDCNTEAGCNDSCGGADQSCSWSNGKCKCIDDPSPSPNPQTEAACSSKCGGAGKYTWDEVKKLCNCDRSTPVEPGKDYSGDNSSAGGTIDLGPPGGTAQNVPEVLNNVINWALGIATSLAVLFIIIGGFRYITSAGNSNMQESAKKTLFAAIIGLVIVVIAFVIITVIIRVVSSS